MEVLKSQNVVFGYVDCIECVNERQVFDRLVQQLSGASWPFHVISDGF